MAEVAGLDAFKENHDVEEIDSSHKIKIGIIGTGWIAESHIAAYKKMEDVEIVALADLVPGKAEALAKKWEVEGCRFYESDVDLLNAEKDLDGVSICTYNGTHASCSINALNAGVNVMLEKPFTVTLDEAVEVVKAEKQSGKILTIGFQPRMSENMKMIKKNDLVLLIAIILTALFETEHDTIYLSGEHLRSKSGHGIGFMHCCRNMSFIGSLQHRIAYITAGPNGNIRLEIVNDLFRVPGSSQHILDGIDVMPDRFHIVASGNIRDVDRADLISFPGDQVLFHVSLGTDKQDLTFRIQFSKLSSYCNSRIDMAGGTAARKQISHRKSS